MGNLLVSTFKSSMLGRILLILITCLILASNCFAVPYSIYIQGPINENSLNILRYNWWFINENARMRGEKVTEVVVWIISEGGKVHEAIAIYDFLQSIKKDGVKVYTVASGMCLSAAMIALQAGDIRYATEHTYLMTHSPYAMLAPRQEPMPYTRKDAEEFIMDVDKCRDQIIGIFARRMKVEKARLYKYFTDVPYNMSAVEAYQIGFIDAVIYSAKEITILQP